jgi:Domain of unknown function (DUF4388)
VALQGTIDTFPLTDVLALLGTSSKSGRLTVDGDRGSATLWVAAGGIVGGEVGGLELDDAATIVFELLRFGDGAFEFSALEPEDVPEPADGTVPMDEGLAAATELLARWDEIEAVVPSLRHRVVLVSDPGRDEVHLDLALWAVVVTAGRTPMVGAIAEELELDEFTACAAIARLVDDGLAEMAEPEVYLPAAADPVDDAPLYDLEDRLDLYGSPRQDDVAEELPAAVGRPPAFPDRFPIDDLLGEDHADHDDPWATPGRDDREAHHDAAVAAAASASSTEDGPDTVVPAPQPALELDPASLPASAWDQLVEAEQESQAAAEPESEAGPGRDDDTADEVLRQMSRLSPKAAEAIAAALSTVPPSAAPQADRDDDEGRGDGPVSFLGSF